MLLKTHSAPASSPPVPQAPGKTQAEINGGPPAEPVAPEKPRDTGPPPARRRPSRPSTSRSHPASGQRAPEREATAGYGWALFIGSILAIAALREGFRLAKHPVSVAAKSVSRHEAAFGAAVLVRFLARIGATPMRAPLK